MCVSSSGSITLYQWRLPCNNLRLRIVKVEYFVFICVFFALFFARVNAYFKACSVVRKFGLGVLWMSIIWVGTGKICCIFSWFVCCHLETLCVQCDWHYHEGKFDVCFSYSHYITNLIRWICMDLERCSICKKNVTHFAKSIIIMVFCAEAASIYTDRVHSLSNPMFSFKPPLDNELVLIFQG